MHRSRQRWASFLRIGTRLTALTAVVGQIAGMSCADDTPQPTATNAEIRAVAAGYDIRLEGADKSLDLQPESVLNWSNPTRQQVGGGMFLWTSQGRPEAIASLFTYQSRGRVLEKHAFQSLSESGLTARYQSDIVWQPREAGLKWMYPESEPSKSQPIRLTQMRALAREYTIQLTDKDGTVTELRLLPQPLSRFASPERGIVDGALFSYVVATDPEALMMVEAVESEGRMKWRCGFARAHYWKLSAVDKVGTEVWNVPQDLQLERNFAGNPEQLHKTYTSFYPQTQVLGLAPATPEAKP
jgi:hypothetical protein